MEKGVKREYYYDATYKYIISQSPLWLKLYYLDNNLTEHYCNIAFVVAMYLNYTTIIISVINNAKVFFHYVFACGVSRLYSVWLNCGMAV